MTNHSGLKYKKFDLHIHTPASTDFKDKKATAEDVVDAAITKGLSGIAITDHQTSKMVDEVKKIGKSKGLIVFPGVELMVHGGKRGIHLIILFDVDKDSEHIKKFLNSVKVF